MKELATRVYSACEDYVYKQNGVFGLIHAYFPRPNNRHGNNTEHIFRCCRGTEEAFVGQVVVGFDNQLSYKNGSDANFEIEIKKRLAIMK